MKHQHLLVFLLAVVLPLSNWVGLVSGTMEQSPMMPQWLFGLKKNLFTLKQLMNLNQPLHLDVCPEVG